MINSISSELKMSITQLPACDSEQSLGGHDHLLADVAILHEGLIEEEVNGVCPEVELVERRLVAQRDTVRELTEVHPALRQAVPLEDRCTAQVDGLTSSSGLTDEDCTTLRLLELGRHPVALSLLHPPIDRVDGHLQLLPAELEQSLDVGLEQGADDDLLIGFHQILKPALDHPQLFCTHHYQSTLTVLRSRRGLAEARGNLLQSQSLNQADTRLSDLTRVNAGDHVLGHLVVDPSRLLERYRDDLSGLLRKVVALLTSDAEGIQVHERVQLVLVTGTLPYLVTTIPSLDPSPVVVLELIEVHVGEAIGVKELPLAIDVVQTLALRHYRTGQQNSVVGDLAEGVESSRLLGRRGLDTVALVEDHELRLPPLERLDHVVASTAPSANLGPALVEDRLALLWTAAMHSEVTRHREGVVIDQHDVEDVLAIRRQRLHLAALAVPDRKSIGYGTVLLELVLPHLDRDD